MSEDKAKMSGGCQGTDQPVRDPFRQNYSESDAGGAGSEMRADRRAYRLFLVERLATFEDCEELRRYLRLKGWTVLATGGLAFPGMQASVANKYGPGNY